MYNYRKYVGLLVLCSLILQFDSCVEPFLPVLNEDQSTSFLVVEGQITDEPGPFKVKLTRSGHVYTDPNNIDYSLPVLGAEVHISDDHGNLFLLSGKNDGWYETEDKNLKGVPGNAYTLLITDIEDGTKYESSPVLMQEVPDIDSVHYEEVQQIHFEKDKIYTENWLKIMVNMNAPSDGKIKYLRWEFVETWEFEIPQYVFIHHGTGETAYNTVEMVDVDYEKRHGWVTEDSKSILIKSTVNSPENSIKDFIIQSIGPPDDRLNIKYSILVKQYALSQGLYDFWKKLQESNAQTGGIYGTIPAAIYGNIYCSNGSKRALGCFSASAVKTKRIFIEHSETNIELGNAYGGCGYQTPKPGYVDSYYFGTIDGGRAEVWSTNAFCTDCKLRGTNIKPDFWK